MVSNRKLAQAFSEGADQEQTRSRPGAEQNHIKKLSSLILIYKKVNRY